MATVTTSIGQGTTHTESVTISSVSGSGPYTVTLSAAVPASVVIGDALWDEAATPNKYLIEGISGSDLTVRDSTGVAAAPDNSGTSGASITRYYNGSTPWSDAESEMDDINLLTAGDDLVWDIYNDAIFDEEVNINGGITIGLNSLSFDTASGEGHDGTEGVGARFVRTTATNNIGAIKISINYQFDCRGIEIDDTSVSADAVYSLMVSHNASTAPDRYLSRFLVHGTRGPDNGYAIFWSFNDGGTHNISNCIVYDVVGTGSTRSPHGIILNNGFSRTSRMVNNTIYGVTASVSDNINGIYINNNSTHTCVGNIVTGVSNSGSGNAFCIERYTPGGNGITITHNATEDETATYRTGNITGIDPSETFINITSGFEDLNLKAGAKVIGAGTDTSATVTDSEFDATGLDRTAIPYDWDMGALQSIGVNVKTSIGQGTTHDENVDISSAAAHSLLANHYDVTLAASSSAVVGDSLWDEHATPRKYLIVGVNGTSIVVRDSTGVGAAPDSSATSTAVIERYYSGSTPITDWESELDDTDLYASGYAAFGECYNDAVFDESMTINGGDTVGLSLATLTVKENERHDGTAETGARIIRNGSGTNVLATSGNRSSRLSWLEISYESNVINIIPVILQGAISRCDHYIVRANNATGSPPQIKYGIMENPDTSDSQIYIHNNIVYSINRTASSIGAGINANGSSTPDAYVYSNTVYNCNNAGTGTAYGIYDGSVSGTRDFQNNISVSNDIDFNLPVHVNESYNTTSDDTVTGTGSLTNITTENQFINITSGFEDLRTVETADVVDAGTTVSGIDSETDISGYNRAERSFNWDIGAYEYPNEVICSIGQGTTHDTAITINSTTLVSGTTRFYDVVLDTTYDANIGDCINEGGFRYRIVSVDGVNLVVHDSQDAGFGPTTGTSSLERYYNGSTPLTDWESELDDEPLYASTETAKGEAYNDANFDEKMTIDGGNTVGLSSVTLTVEENERHDGTEGTGARIVRSGGGQQIVGGSAIPVRFEWLEIDYNNFGVASNQQAFSINVSSLSDPNRHLIHHILIHDANGYRWFIMGSHRFYIYNSIIYNGTASVGQAGSALRIGQLNRSINNIVYNNIGGGNTTVSAKGIEGSSSNVDFRVQNNIVCETSNIDGEATEDFAVSVSSPAVESHNASSDSTADGAGSLTNITTADQFVNITSGFEDLHLKRGSDCIDAGTDLTSTGIEFIEFDIDNEERSDSWDIGADQTFYSSVVLITGTTRIVAII